MPELPEVETVRAGLARWVVGRQIAAVEVLHPRAIRRHLAGPLDFTGRLSGLVFDSAVRRGQYLWLPLRSGDGSVDHALIGHLGMSGQLLVQAPELVDPMHLRVRFRFADDGDELRFVDQRTFGGLILDDLVATSDRPGANIPALVAHIARDPLDPAFDEGRWVMRTRRSDSAIKRTLLDQTLISGVGNIYADESLWRAKLHGRRRSSALTRKQLLELLGQVRAVMTEALAQGGTSFDSLYVNVNGQSGYFDRSLDAYGREGKPCHRCGTPIRREGFMNRSSFFCPVCQRPPRRRTGP
ncbi:MAG: formamidopyrimidine-DNA glycosylase [Pseudonocardiales bacterium]|nr:formamidopyrimidine-DNA glycosylase [Pseudonocardiales bacterium]